MKISRRKLLSYSGAVALSGAQLPAISASWIKVGQSTGAINNWQKVAPVLIYKPIAISAGGYHSLALRSDGAVLATGGNPYGQLGFDDVVQRKVFTAVPGLENIIAISAGNSHSLALRSDGAVFAAGINSNGQLGLNDTTNSKVFTQTTLP